MDRVSDLAVLNEESGRAAGVVACNRVDALAEQLSVANHDGSNRHFLLVGRPVCQRQGPAHPLLVFVVGSQER